MTGLEPTTEYVIRLVAKNPAGHTDGEPSKPISTLAYAPARGDKSSWLIMVSEEENGNQKKKK